MDVLEELSGTELEELAQIYQNHSHDYPHLHSFLQCCLKSKKLQLDHVQVFCPKNWRRNGTFVASMPRHGHDIVLHSLDPKGTDLLEALKKTKRFQYTRNPNRNVTVFFAVHENFIGPIHNLLVQQKCELLQANLTNLWCLRQQEGIKFEINIASEAYLKKVEAKDVPLIMSLWEHTYAAATQKRLNFIKLTPGYGLYLKSNHQLVAWVTSSCLGQIASLHTLKEHRNKGYGTVVLKAMIKSLAENGFDACATVHIGNTASEALMKKLGFKIINRCRFFDVHNKN
ncbi:unnamed protein product [Ceutorhynchus assimilis]|uniref:N-acetyltransferase domain-containing protein n=1 Tax=Ceutorhynchus assimilis TaxID=467358 RepID=A0A9N9QAR2_9CUCU|nr:unnamed protein product [Ceutorhynchus assimilis]